MKICLYSPYGLLLQLFETELDIAQRYLDKGYEVEIITCNSFLPACELNPEKKIDYCLNCISRSRNGLKLLTGKVKQINLMSFLSKENIDFCNELKFQIRSIEDLKKIEVLGFNIGSCVYSSLIDYAKNPFPVLRDYNDVLTRFFKASLFNFFCFENYLKINKPNKVVLFNGRHALTKPLIYLSKKSGIDFDTYEYSNFFDKYNIYKNTQPHDFRYRHRILENMWKESAENIDSKVEQAKQFFDINRNKNGKTAFFHTSHQTQGTLPENFNKSKHNVVIFTSSEFESYAAFDYSEDGVYQTQYSGICEIINSLQKINTNLHIYIKLHPYLKSIDENSNEITQYDNLKKEFLTIIFPSSKVDTYTLIDNCDKVVSFLSTTSVEAAYMNKPSIILSKHLFSLMNFAYKPQSHSEVISLLLNPHLKPIINVDVFKYGYFMMKYGNKYKYYQPFRREIGVFKRKVIKPHLFISNIEGYLLKRNFINIKLIMEKLYIIILNLFFFRKFSIKII